MRAGSEALNVIRQFYQTRRRMRPEEFLGDRERTHVLIEERIRSDVVVAAPHHAPLGVKTLPCKEHEVSDENAGFLARHIAKRLNCHSIVAINATIDGNKALDTYYSRTIVAWAPLILLEIHGHGDKSAKFDVEVSCGSAEREGWAVRLAGLVSKRCEGVTDLAGYTVSGDFNQIYFKARKSVTIGGGPWLGVHIELPPDLRNGDEENPVPTAGWLFADQIAASVEDLAREYRAHLGE